MSNHIYIPHQLDKNYDFLAIDFAKFCIYIPHQLDKNCTCSDHTCSNRQIYIPHQLDKNLLELKLDYVDMIDLHSSSVR